MTGKFKVGDKVYDICRGIGVVTISSKSLKDQYPLIVEIHDEQSVGYSHRNYTIEGLLHVSDINPALLTIPEARAKGYDVPVKVVKRHVRMECFIDLIPHFTGGSVYLIEKKINTNPLKKATVTFEWEEEV